MANQKPKALEFPFVEIRADRQFTKRLNTGVQEVRAKSYPFGFRAKPATTANPVDLSVEPIVILKDLLRTGTNEELMAFLKHPRGQAINSWNVSHLKKIMEARAETHLDELDGCYSSLLDRMGSQFYWTKFSFAQLAKKWRPWAETLTDRETFDEDVDALFKFEIWDHGPMEVVAKYVPIATHRFVQRLMMKGINTRPTRIFLNRTDLPASTLRFFINNELSYWGKGALRRANQGHDLKRILQKPQWQEEDFPDKLLAAALRVKKAKRPYGEKFNWGGHVAEMLGYWSGGDEAFWQKIIDIFKDDQKLLARTMKNPNFPKSVAKKYLDEGAGSEIRLAISRNKAWVQDKEFRQALEKSGQDTQVWWNLLESSQDKDEATRLFSYLATKDIKKAAYYMKEGKFPEGTVVATEVLTQMISQENKEDRVAVIKALPGIRPEKGLTMELPERGKKGVKR